MRSFIVKIEAINLFLKDVIISGWKPLFPRVWAWYTRHSITYNTDIHLILTAAEKIDDPHLDNCENVLKAYADRWKAHVVVFHFIQERKKNLENAADGRLPTSQPPLKSLSTTEPLIRIRTERTRWCVHVMFLSFYLKKRKTKQKKKKKRDLKTDETRPISFVHGNGRDRYVHVQQLMTLYKHFFKKNKNFSLRHSSIFLLLCFVFF